MEINLYDILKNVLNESVEQASVVDAINNKYRVFIDYSDKENNAPGQRLIEPYVLGITKAGNLALRAYQYQGATLRGIPKWKLFLLGGITKWRPLKNSTFNQPPAEQGWDAPDYNREGDKTLVQILAQAKFNEGNDDGLYQPSLDKLRKQTDSIKNHSNALDLSKLETTPKGPIRQKKNNVYTSRPNSKQYDMIRKNIEYTNRDQDNMNKYWGDYDKAEQEMNYEQELGEFDNEMNNNRGPVKNLNKNNSNNNGKNR